MLCGGASGPNAGTAKNRRGRDARIQMLPHVDLLLVAGRERRKQGSSSAPDPCRNRRSRRRYRARGL